MFIFQLVVVEWFVDRIPVSLESAIEKYSHKGFSTFLIGRVDGKDGKKEIVETALDHRLNNKMKAFDELRANRRFFEKLKKYVDLRFGEGMLLRAGYRPFVWGEPHGVYLADLGLDWTSVTRVQNDNAVCQKAYKEMELFDRYFPFERKNT